MADKTLIMKEAQKYLAKGQIDKAISEWEKLIKESPDGNTYNIIGDLYLKKGDKKVANESFHKSAKFFRQEGFSLKAVALYKKVLNINPSDADALYSLGELSEEKGLSTDAIKYYLATADSLSKEGKKERLLDIYEKILSLSPANIPLRNKVAEIFLKEGLKTDASKEYIFIAGIYDEKGDLPKAREYYQKVLDIQPSSKEAVIGIGRLYEKSGEIENAIEYMKQATSLFPEDPDVIFRYAEISLKGGYGDISKDYLYKLIGLDPENIRPRRLLGEIYLNEGLKDKAWEEYLPVVDKMILEEEYSAAIKLLEPFKETEPLEACKRLVSLYRQLGEDAHVASELTCLGNALLEKDMKEEAMGCYRDALELRPDDLRLKEKITELAKELEAGKEAITVHISEGDKTAEEILVEADIFSRYGLLSEAIRLLEGLKMREPQNIDVHMRLKSLYIDSADKESSVTEYLILNELYKRLGDVENSEKMLREAFEISPEDPRLAERGFLEQETSYAASGEGEFTEPHQKEASIEDYEEDIAEADFYARQGLTLEAEKILERLHSLFPENRNINERLDNLGLASESLESEEISETAGPQEGPFEGSPATPEGESKETVNRDEKEGYEDFMLTDQDLVEAEEIPEPSLDNDVLEVFHEFKKGLEQELGEEDSETHYNLGIAYKEMGLLDDAIKEFQTARNDSKRFIQASTMLGICYMEKGLYSLVIDVLSNVIKGLSAKEEAYWPIKYDLAEAYEKNGGLREALDLYTEVYGWDAGFRNVSENINRIRILLVKAGDQEKPKERKERKDRVSYL